MDIDADVQTFFGKCEPRLANPVWKYRIGA